MDRKRYLLPHAFALVWAAGAAYLLTQDAQDSSRLSGGLAAFLLSLPFFRGMGPLAFERTLRKLTHFGIYAVEGFAIALPGGKHPLALVPVGAAMSCAGEAAQLLANGRSCEAADMAIDFSGYVLGMWLAQVVRCILRKAGKNKERKNDKG